MILSAPVRPLIEWAVKQTIYRYEAVADRSSPPPLPLSFPREPVILEEAEGMFCTWKLLGLFESRD